MPQKIIDITGEDDPDKPTVITILPGKDPYDQIDAEEDAHEYMVGDETKSEIQEIWKGMAEVKEKERDYYNQLAGMVYEMTPNDIYATVQVTPRPGTTLPQCAEDLLEELGNEETFRRILAVGYMAWEKYEKNRTKKAEVPYKPSTIREVAKKFLTTTSRIKDIQHGEAIT